MSKLRPRTAERLLVVFSDIEMGAGGSWDDFPHSDFLADLLLSYTRAPYEGLHVDLVFNGDTFDLLKTAYLDAYPRHITRDVAVGKMSRVSAAHSRFFEALRQFLGGSAERRVYFLAGNHDPEILFPEVQQLIRSLCGSERQVLFPGLHLSIGRVRIEHGSQYDPLYMMDPDSVFVPWDGQEILNISWAAAAVLDIAMPLQPLLHFHDRLKPKKEVFDLIPEIRELLLTMFWRYWTRDYWKGYFGSNDPINKLSWSMVKELVWRWGSRNAEVLISDELERRIEESDRYRLYIIGHMHQSRHWSFGDRKVIQTGCFRNEYMLEDEGRVLRPIPKSYAEVYLADGAPLVSHLIELEGPPAPPGYLPASIFDVRDGVRQLLAEAQQRPQERRAQLEQEEREAAETER